MDRKPTLDIVIVNWNAGEQLADCVRSIGAARRDGFVLRHAIIVDNGSTDGSLEVAREAARAADVACVAIRNAENQGFGRACNQGAKASTADFILFLNPDAMLFVDSLSEPFAYLEKPENASVGVVGVQLIGADGSVARSCARAPTPSSMAAAGLGLDKLIGRRFSGYVMADWDHDSSRDVDHVIGAFYLVRRAAFEQAGGFDERFFVYLEDLDLSLRLKRAGWRLRYLASARAYHRGGGVSERARARRLAYSLESRLRFSFKHFDAGSAMGLAMLTLAVEPTLRLALAARELSPARAAETLGGYARLGTSLATSIGRALLGLRRPSAPEPIASAPEPIASVPDDGAGDRANAAIPISRARSEGTRP